MSWIVRRMRDIERESRSWPAWIREVYFVCTECERRARYMAADPEMYRGEDTRCDAHRPIDLDKIARALGAERRPMPAHIRELLRNVLDETDEP